MLGSCDTPLWERYDLGMVDLDGVVYIGGAAVPGAPERLARARAAGMHIAFITNNASRPPATVAEHLQELGVDASVDDVVNSAQATASLVLADHGAGARVVALGGEGLVVALEEKGLVPVGVGDDAVAIASGYGPDLRWREIMRAAIRIREGLPWTASNTDMSIPTSDGIGPGHGVLVRMVSEFAGVEPQVAGKPSRPLLDETRARVGGERALMIGDRLDTDIAGGHAAEVDALLVLTGVTGLPELVTASPEERPTYISADLSGLGTAHCAPARGESGWELGGWLGEVRDGVLTVTGAGDAGDWWRVAASAGWTATDESDSDGTPIDLGRLPEPPVNGE